MQIKQQLFQEWAKNNHGLFSVVLRNTLTDYLFYFQNHLYSNRGEHQHFTAVTRSKHVVYTSPPTWHCWRVYLNTGRALVVGDEWGDSCHRLSHGIMWIINACHQPNNYWLCLKNEGTDTVWHVVNRRMLGRTVTKLIFKTTAALSWGGLI